jgi:hypothetical protein
MAPADTRPRFQPSGTRPSEAAPGRRCCARLPVPEQEYLGAIGPPSRSVTRDAGRPKEILMADDRCSALDAL